MLIKNVSEYLRVLTGRQTLGALFCNVKMTSQKPRIEDNLKFCHINEGRGVWIDPMCSRLFPEIIYANLCPCDVYTYEEIIRICDEAINEYRATTEVVRGQSEI